MMIKRPSAFGLRGDGGRVPLEGSGMRRYIKDETDRFFRYRRHGGPLPPGADGADSQVYPLQYGIEPLPIPTPPEEFFRETYGVIVYQEQCLSSCAPSAATVWGRPHLPQAMGKKKAEVMVKEKANL
jgi:hypothetical protein